ncbi:hypothetical protein ACFV2V_09300 [Streptomyces sp. NPDC059698]|nr:hypothetical protein [Streptomyces sp. CB02366]
MDQFKASPVPLEASALPLVYQEGGRGTGVRWNEQPNDAFNAP